MKRFIFLVCVMICSIEVFAQEPTKHDSRWKEAHRLNKDQYKIRFDDTMVLYTQDRSTFSILRDGLLLRAKINEGVLDFVYHRFKVTKNEPEEVILYEAPYYHIFHRDFVHLEHADAPEKMAAMKAPEQTIQDFTTRGFEGHWRPYKKESLEGQPVPPKNEFLRDLIIGEHQLKLFLWEDPTNEPSFSNCEINGGALIFSNEQQKQRVFEIKKAEGNELILVDELGMIYFLRKYR